MGLGISPRKFKIVLESNFLKFPMLVGRLGVADSMERRSAPKKNNNNKQKENDATNNNMLDTTTDDDNNNNNNICQ